MCIFTGPVWDVSDTKIFARLSGNGTQFLVYQMTYGTSRDIAMVLPLPISSHAEDAVKFIALDGYADFFGDLEQAFHFAGRSQASHGKGLAGGTNGILPVHQVGDFEASFVPTLDDFDRLDERFKLPRQTWDQLPGYADYGFAVFKLRKPIAHISSLGDYCLSSGVSILSDDVKKVGGEIWHNGRLVLGAGDASDAAVENTQDVRVHPMAFEFPSSLMDTLFFPTVHIHDGKVHQQEQFDHAIYWQGNPSTLLKDFRRSVCKLSDHVPVERAKGIVAGSASGYKMSLKGLRPNQDLLLTLETQSV